MRSKFLVIKGAKGYGEEKISASSATLKVAASASGGGDQILASTEANETVSVESSIMTKADEHLDQVRTARLKGYEGDPCGECGNFTLVRNGTCLKCLTCGGTSGCS